MEAPYINFWILCVYVFIDGRLFRVWLSTRMSWGHPFAPAATMTTKLWRQSRDSGTALAFPCARERYTHPPPVSLSKSTTYINITNLFVTFKALLSPLLSYCSVLAVQECHCMLFLTEDNDFAGEEQNITIDEIKDGCAGM
jgi:hypothetical protein